MATTPNTGNYYIGKGIVSFRKSGDSDYRDFGNATVFEFAPNITTLSHYSSRTGVKTKDRQVVTEKSATINLTLEEWTIENLQLALLGDQPEQVSSANNKIFNIFASNQISGELRFVGTNDVGPRFQWDLPNVSFVPGKSVNPISEGWGALELVGDVLAETNGFFGTITEISEQVAEAASA
jgi:hypothetical protein